jgi:hypothetical protein
MRSRAGLFAPLFAATARTDAIAQKPAKATDPVGTYEIVFEMEEGQAQMSQLTLTRAKDGELGGILGIHGQPTNLEEVVWADRKLSFHATVPHGRISVSVVFDGNGKFTGTYSVDAMGSGKITGARRKTG